MGQRSPSLPHSDSARAPADEGAVQFACSTPVDMSQCALCAWAMGIVCALEFLCLSMSCVSESCAWRRAVVVVVVVVVQPPLSESESAGIRRWGP